MIKIPFSWLPGSWGLKGKTREIAKIEYELSRNFYEKDVAIARVNFDDDKAFAEAKAKIDFKHEKLSKEQYERKLIEIKFDGDLTQKQAIFDILVHDRKHQLITKEEYDYKMAEFTYENEKDRKLAFFGLDKKYNKITEQQYEKNVATLNDEPWVGVIGSEFNPRETHDGFNFELDWNDQFITMLRKHGYKGATDNELVEQWFEDTAYDQLSFGGDEEVIDTSVPRTVTTQERLDNNKTKHT